MTAVYTPRLRPPAHVMRTIAAKKSGVLTGLSTISQSRLVSTVAIPTHTVATPNRTTGECLISSERPTSIGSYRLALKSCPLDFEKLFDPGIGHDQHSVHLLASKRLT